jgi:hypothetical protein
LAIAKTIIMWRAAPLRPDTVFFSVPRAPYPPHEAMQHLETGSFRVLLKRPENYDLRFRELIDQLFTQVADSLGGFGGNRIVRLEAGLLITSAATTTPFHFDPEIGFFSQIEGEKIYHLYPPSILGDEELERFYKLGRVAIAQIDLEGRDPAREHSSGLGQAKGCISPKTLPIGSRRAGCVLFPIRLSSRRKRAAPGDVPGRSIIFCAALSSIQHRPV